MHLAVGWVDPRAGLVAVEKSFLSLPGIETQFPYLPARSLVITYIDRTIPAPFT